MVFGRRYRRYLHLDSNIWQSKDWYSCFPIVWVCFNWNGRWHEVQVTSPHWNESRNLVNWTTKYRPSRASFASKIQPRLETMPRTHLSFYAGILGQDSPRLCPDNRAAGGGVIFWFQWHRSFCARGIPQYIEWVNSRCFPADFRQATICDHMPIYATKATR